MKEIEREISSESIATETNRLKIPNRTDISERPDSVNSRSRYGGNAT